MQEQIQQLHTDNEKQKLAAKEELAALKKIRKEIGQSSESKSGANTQSEKVSTKPLVLSAKIAEVDLSKTIDPTPLRKKQKVAIRRSHEFSTFRLEDKDSDEAGVSIESDQLIFERPDANSRVNDELTKQIKEDQGTKNDMNIKSAGAVSKEDPDIKLGLEEPETKPKGNLFKKRRVKAK